jgi:hypothetical protein
LDTSVGSDVVDMRVEASSTCRWLFSLMVDKLGRGDEDSWWNETRLAVGDGGTEVTETFRAWGCLEGMGL